MGRKREKMAENAAKSGRGRAAAGGHADSQCQSGSGNCNSLELHRDYLLFLLLLVSGPRQHTNCIGCLMSFHYTQIDGKSKLFSSKINDKAGTVTILT